MFNFLRRLFGREVSEAPVVAPEPPIEPVVPEPYSHIIKECVDYHVNRRIKDIVVHCSATRLGRDDHVNVDVIREWHLAREFNDVGYHFIIPRSGVLETGRNMNIAGAHVRGHNANSIGICLVGGYDRDGSPHVPVDVLYNANQLNTLDSLVRALVFKFGGVTILGHRDYHGVSKECPCFDVRSRFFHLSNPHSH